MELVCRVGGGVCLSWWLLGCLGSERTKSVGCGVVEKVVGR